MAEVYIPYSLVTPAATLTFNPGPGQDGYWLTDVEGLDAPAERVQVDNRPGADGGIVFDGYDGPRFPTLTGYIRSFASLTTRRTFEDSMRAACRSIRRADGTLLWTPTGGVQRQTAVRLYQALQITSDASLIKTFAISLVAADGTAVYEAQTSGSTSALTTATGSFGFPFAFPFTFGAASGGGQVSITPGGDVETYPLVRIFGACSDPKIVNVATGAYVSLPGLSIAAGQYVDVDMRLQTVMRGGTVSVISNLDVSNSTFWSLAAGVAQTVQLVASSFDSNAAATVFYSNAWA